MQKESKGLVKRVEGGEKESRKCYFPLSYHLFARSAAYEIYMSRPLVKIIFFLWPARSGKRGVLCTEHSFLLSHWNSSRNCNCQEQYLAESAE